jgi:hypothetical protein
MFLLFREGQCSQEPASNRKNALGSISAVVRAEATDPREASANKAAPWPGF